MTENTAEDIIANAVGILKSGGVVAYPTDTVYGLGALYDNVKSIERVYQIKRRLNIKALPLIVSDRQQLLTLIGYLPPVAETLIDIYWPGALTLILKRSEAVPDIITGGRDTVAVRMPDHPVALSLARRAGKAICGTSANISGSDSAKTAAEITSQLEHIIDCIVDLRPEPSGIESTIIDVSREPGLVLREGKIKAKELLQYINLQGA